MLLIDAHLDLSWSALSWDRDITRPLDEVRQSEAALTDHSARGRATVTLPEMRKGKVAVCLATLLSRVTHKPRPIDGAPRRNLDVATQSIACGVARGQLGYYRWLEETGEAVIIRSAGELAAHWKRWEQGGDQLPIGFIIAMEGADPIVTPAQAETWFADGLRCVGLAHYGPSAYAVGTGTAGPLTPAGVELLREFDRLGMIVDLTHSSDPSFFQALDTFNGPVIASHNNCRAIIPGDRQYSDEQIKLLIQRNAVIGVACDGWMLFPNYRRGETPRESITFSNLADHIDHICQIAGNTAHVGIGSDLDGGFGFEQTPAELNSIADLQKLSGVLSSRGYAEADIAAIFHGNWKRFFLKHLPRH